MADQLPDPNTPAATGPAASGPQQPGASGPAGDQAAQSISFDSFSEDDKKYLAGQGITKQEELTSEALVKVINHARSSQKTAAERQAEIDRIKGAITPPNPDPNTPPVNPGTTPTAPQQPAPSSPAQGLDDVTALTLATSLSIQFPELKDKLADGSFYSEMNTLGIPTVTPSGQVNLTGITNYGKLAQQQAQSAARLAELDKPGEGNIPDANPTLPKQPTLDPGTALTRQQALAILSQDPNHERAEEARKIVAMK